MASVNWNQYAKEAEAAGESVGEYTPVPAGTYETKITKCVTKKTAKGKDMLVCTHAIENGPHAGRLVWHNMVFSPESPKAVAIFIRQLRALGQGELLDASASFEQIAGGLTNQLATITVTVGEYQNKPKNDVANVAGRSFDPAAGPKTVKTPTGLPI